MGTRVKADRAQQAKKRRTLIIKEPQPAERSEQSREEEVYTAKRVKQLRELGFRPLAVN
jgi:hypothetical protein